MTLAKDLAEKTIDIVRSYLESKLLSVHVSLSEMGKALSEKVSKEYVETTLRDTLKAYAPFDPAPLEAKIEEVKNLIPSAIQGEKGEPGKDAPPLDIVPIGPIAATIASYPEGTVASFDGGLWKASKATNGKEGWVNIVNGIKDIRIDLANGRDITVEVELSSGEKNEKKFSLPTMTYAGVYEEGKEYIKGDMVTHKGAMWHCNEPTSDKPGDGKLWTLAVKRGQDAKGA